MKTTLFLEVQSHLKIALVDMLHHGYSVTRQSIAYACGVNNQVNTHNANDKIFENGNWDNPPDSGVKHRYRQPYVYPGGLMPAVSR